MSLRRRRPLWLGVTVAVYALVGLTGIGAALKAAEMRTLFSHLEDVRRTRDGHLEEYKYLLLERATLKSYQDVERIAVAELDMRFPDEVRLAGCRTLPGSGQTRRLLAVAASEPEQFAPANCLSALQGAPAR
ncbi:MAG: hypothetical protein F4Y01_10670 [Gammaproteobacteria bacterium]|nr:hypothetical protein [Gammaproteobacteria bacterium]